MSQADSKQYILPFYILTNLKSKIDFSSNLAWFCSSRYGSGSYSENSVFWTKVLVPSRSGSARKASNVQNAAHNFERPWHKKTRYSPWRRCWPALPARGKISCDPSTKSRLKNRNIIIKWLPIREKKIVKAWPYFLIWDPWAILGGTPCGGW